MTKQKKLLLFRDKIRTDPVIKKVSSYLESTEGKYSVKQPEFGGRLALIQAKKAFLSGNYGVGASLIVCKSKVTEIYLGQNKIVTGKPTERFNTHAETDSIKKWVSSLEKKSKPDLIIKNKNEKPEICIYTNLEPCPKCEMEITMLLALAKEYISPQAIIRSISLNTDGALEPIEGVRSGNASAHALGIKHLTTPFVWRSIQRGYFPPQKPPTHPPVQFSLLSTSAASLQGYAGNGFFIKTIDRELIKLSWDIFAKTREKIDQFLITGKIYKN